MPGSEITIEQGSDRRSQWGPSQKVYYITCDGCHGFSFERSSVTEARFFANVHNEETHQESLTIMDSTVVKEQATVHREGSD